MSKNIVIISDLHSGSVYGLVPPDYYSTHYASMQSESWQAYCKLVKKWAKPDVLIVNGDLIEGRQKAQGGAELVTIDRNVQCDMAEISLEMWEAKKIFLSYGSTYHVSEQAEDFEYNIAKNLGAVIEGRLFLNIEGLTFDIRHKVGRSSIPHGRATPLLRAMMWALLKEAEGSGPKVDIIVRSHVHYHLWIEQPGKIAFTTPALQLSRGRFGSRECEGTTHWGAIRLTINKGQIIGKDVDICKLQGNKHRIIKLG